MKILSDYSLTELVDLVLEKTGMKAEFKKVGAISPNKMEACMKALHGLVLSADVKADEITDQEAIESFNETAKGEYENAEDQYNTAREKEGWAAKTGDTVLGWFGCITKEDMDGKLAAYKGDIEKLQFFSRLISTNYNYLKSYKVKRIFSF